MIIKSFRSSSILASAVAAVLLAGCAGTMARDAELEQAQASYQNASNDPALAQAAPEQLRKASVALNQSTNLQKQGAPQADVDHYADIAIQQVAIARQVTAADRSQAYVKQGGDQRNQMLLHASKQQTQQAQMQADTANAKAADSDTKVVQAQQQTQLAQMQADTADTNAANTAAQAAQAQQQNTALLAALDAKQTDRGLVLTLGSVLFDSDAADLNASGERSLDKLAQFMHDNPKRNIRVEGYTDSTGTAAYNQDLSKRRADAVSSALVDDGVDAQRTVSRGFGEEFAVASNRTASGRQQNRRVEIVISDADGQFAQTR